MLCYVMLCYVMLCYVMLCYVMLCYVMLCYVMLCYVMLCYVMLCYVMLCYVMLCYVMLCYVILYYIIAQFMFHYHINALPTHLSLCFKLTVTYMLTVLGLRITTERISAAQTLTEKQTNQNYGIHFHHLSLVCVP